ncbi:chemotaxis protein CheW [Trichocoleus sp. FACHB-90]|uniref:chemotaxis protein CheW n=1 Tax=Cyanophyceae TaxID=3028117 RepID=UPI0016833D09|nr:chemotaxis protein CheW [Trichocoleus sp. FACHB-90]MBD1925815.1 chemotaxis protein CheW [Trichocoleus sp. FACHB-90]
MESKQYIIFRLNAALYGVEALSVQEIFFLPELTPIVEAPPAIVGALNLRGEILPIMDLQLRFGYELEEYRLTDSIIVLQCQRFRFGIIVNQVLEVQTISINKITAELSYGQEGTNSSYFVAGFATVGTDIVRLLNPENLIQFFDRVEAVTLEETVEGKSKELYTSRNSFKENRVFCPNATPEERAIFQERVANLMRQAEIQNVIGSRPIAVIGLNNEYFGLDLAVVREFTDIRHLQPIPCCPAHILGNMNLRGEILTLIDIRMVLNLEIANVVTASKAMVVYIDDLVVGVMIDAVFDVIYLNPSQMMPVPAAAHSMNDEYLQGTALYRETMMCILDLTKILLQGGLMVDEQA